MAAAPIEFPPPTFDRLVRLGECLGYDTRFDWTLAACRADLGPSPDFADPAVAVRLRDWLNDWLTRVAEPKPGGADYFAAAFPIWWAQWQDRLPDPHLTLARAADRDLKVVADAYDDLRRVPVSERKTVAMTGGAKLLFYVRPFLVPPWDAKISRHVGRDRTGAGFLLHLEKCRGWAREIVAEAVGRGVDEAGIGMAVGRPLSSLAKLIDEYLYTVITRGWDPDGPAGSAGT